MTTTCCVASVGYSQTTTHQRRIVVHACFGRFSPCSSARQVPTTDGSCLLGAKHRQVEQKRRHSPSTKRRSGSIPRPFPGLKIGSLLNLFRKLRIPASCNTAKHTMCWAVGGPARSLRQTHVAFMYGRSTVGRHVRERAVALLCYFSVSCRCRPPTNAKSSSSNEH